MFVAPSISVRTGKFVVFALLLSAALASPFTAHGSDRKKKGAAANAEPAAPAKPNDYSKLIWPAPPDPTRIRYMDYFAGMKYDATPERDTKKKKQGWMDRMAGTPEGAEKQEKSLKDFPFQLIGPYGVAVDSKGLVYVGDEKVGAIFIFNPETRDVELIKNGTDARFGMITGIAIDDNDRLFVADSKFAHVLVFNAAHKAEGVIKEGMITPNGVAIDTENRLLYVVDTEQDQVLVYDADTYKPLRRIGTGGKKHALMTPGDFAKPTNVAVDGEGNVYVTDTLNDRVEIFDADGNFITTFGKNCDAPGCFERPKGLAVDSDGNIWVADSVMDRLQILNRKGEVLMVIGGHGTLPSQFSDMVGVGYDKARHRMFTTEQYPGRVQEFRYITEEEISAQKQREADERKKKREAAAAPTASVSKPEAGAAPKSPGADAQQPAAKPAPVDAQAPAAK
jgi:DNA-binding beta-propeller fold protein YncE